MIGKKARGFSKGWKILCFSAALAFAAGPARAATLCVWTNSPHPGAPYNAWTNAAREIQTAVDAAVAGDTVLVTNGVYVSGGAAAAGHGVSNRVLIATSIVVRSVNGPAVTVIRGRAAGDTALRRCVYITGGGQLAGFTLTNGLAGAGALWVDQLGGGVLVERGGRVSNCVVAGNTAIHGGGIAVYYGGEVRNCLVHGNTAGSGSWYYGGGFYGSQGATVCDSVFSNNAGEVGGGVSTEGNCTIARCVVVNNQAVSGGGVSLKTGDVVENCLVIGNVAARSGGGASFSAGFGTLRNCTVAGNVAQLYPDRSGTYHVSGGTLVNCILAQNGDGLQNLDPAANYTADHLCATPVPSNGTGHVTLDPRLLGDYRPATNSPCIDAGGPSGATDDFAGVPRPLDGNGDGTNTGDIGAFESVHPLADSDGDAMRDCAEIRAGTGVLDASSYLSVGAVQATNAEVIVSWPGVAGRRYTLERATNLGTTAFNCLVRTNIDGVSPLNVQTDATVVGLGPWMYRVRVE